MSTENDAPASEDQIGFNENHRRHLTVSFRHMDQILTESETIMASGDSPSPFGRYVPDMTPVQRRVTHDHISRIRETMRHILGELNIPLPSPDCGVMWALRSQLIAISISLEGLSPRQMRGFGTIPDAAAAALNRIRPELQAQVGRLENYLSQAGGGDLQERLRRLERTSHEAGLLREIDRIITGHGLIEFRGAMGMLLDRMENPSFEIGVFGRVSSGKSSLLNHLLGRDVLPIGVTPVTAVPIRIGGGGQSSAVVEFAEDKSLTIELEKLSEFCSEQGNPGNAKHVTRIRVQLPIPLLQQGVTFVDTPGLGSLALSGAEETLAYLPRCDLGIVLVDGSSTITSEDLNVVEMLYRAGATAMVLISKADVLSPSERELAIAYARGQIHHQVRLDTPVFAVSVRGGEAVLGDDWMQQSLEPILTRHRDEASSALKRKAGALRESVMEALRQRLQRQPRTITQDMRAERENALRALREGESVIESAQRGLPDPGSGWTQLPALILDAAAQAIVATRARRVLPQNDAVTIVTTTAMTYANKATTPLREQLDQLHTRLSRCLQTAERTLDQSASVLEALPGSAGMPVPDFAAAARNFVLSEPPLLARWSGKLLRLWIRGKFRDHIEPELGSALTRYGQQMRAWTRQYVDELRRNFWSRAELCRARLIVPSETVGTNDVERENDLRLLERWGL